MAALLSGPSKKKEKTTPINKDSGRGAPQSATSRYLETSPVVQVGLFIIFSALVVIISFLGQSPKGPQLINKQPAPQRIVAEFPFEFESELLTKSSQEAIRAQIPPVFQRTYAPYENFLSLITELSSSYAKTQIEFEDEGDQRVEEEYRKQAEQVITASGIPLDLDILLGFITATSPRERSSLSEEALEVLKTLYDDGVYADRTAETPTPAVTVIQLTDQQGQNSLPNARSLSEARIELRVSINSLSREGETARMLYELYNPGLEINLVYSRSETEQVIQTALAKVEPTILSFEAGETLIQPGAIVNLKDLEIVTAYNKAQQDYGSDSFIANPLFMERLTMTLILLFAIYIYIRQGLRNIYKRNHAIVMIAVAILINLLIIRIVVEIGNVADATNRPFLSMLPFLVPYALAPMLVAVLVGPGPAVLCSLIISVLFGITQNNSISFMLIAFLSGVTGSYYSSNIRRRSKLVRAGLYAGLSAAIAGSFIGLLSHYSYAVVGQQFIVALIIGLLTGVAAIGLLPVFEHLFKVTTEITLLELTDFNHPLLRRMQMEAPGTYHHSLMVANLSENAAAAIGASPLLCRVCCFFHDIGKLVKPEYFVENQRDGINPHNEKNPSMSALVIKAHVKEGVELAKKYKLPRVIIDVIRQHHGTTLIQYFYYQAQQQTKGTNAPYPTKSGRSSDTEKVDESTYRYDGPRPAFKESAIIFFADSLEAASRSLRKVSQPAIEELIDKIFEDRIADEQLDECPLTFHELALIKSSFVYTLLNMLHSRIEYPKESAETEATPKDDRNDRATTGDQQPV